MFCFMRRMRKHSRRDFVAGGAVFVASASAPLATAAAPKDIIDTAISAGSFKTLAAAVKAAGLVETLKGEGPFTVFAPTDEAFARLAPGTVDDLLKPENLDKLKAVLTYHVVSGRVAAAQARSLDKAKTVNGQDLAIRAFGESLLVDHAKVVTADVACTNGVIHAIDSVLLPK